MAEATAVVCTQGASPLLGHTLRALLEQEGVELEIVVVVDGDAGALAVATGLEASPIRFVAERARGLNTKRNRGIEEATADRVMFTDDDCVPAPDWARCCAAALDVCPVVTGRVVPLNDGYRVSLRKGDEPRVYSGTLRHVLAPWTVGNGNNLAVTRAVIARLGGFREDIGVGTWSGAACDTELLFRALRDAATSIRYEPAAVVYHAQPRDRADYLRKRRMYYRGLSYMVRHAHARDPVAWLLGATRLGATFAEMVLAHLLLLRTGRERTLTQCRGALEGLFARAAEEAA